MTGLPGFPEFPEFPAGPSGPAGAPLMMVLYRPDEGVGYVPVPCVTALLRSTSMQVMYRSADSPAEDDLIDVAALLQAHADAIAEHLALAQVRASMVDVEAPPPRRGGVFNPRNWWTWRR